MSPTAPLLLALASLFGWSYGQTVQQSPTHFSVLEGQFLQLNCTYTGAFYFFWYVQYPNRGLELLVSSLGQTTHRGFTVNEEKKYSLFYLSKGEATVTDSAVYFCAASDTVPYSGLTPVT
ncbi:hypothetical protein XELAEV_18007225mg [Xenopus laevis]|uniref:Immunoglobulin domain-containing protein n=1 Tax=Xenopus laevis TaxID=8355 RepID=A0A974I4S9_XENLA|nr:hypothetical protein XELAEV_18007225mg [Xenopus laevis]